MKHGLSLAWLLSVAVGASIVEASTYDYAGENSKTGQQTNSWNLAASWTNGPQAFPNAAGDVARTTTNIDGYVTFNLNQDITLGTLNWSGRFLEIRPGSPAGRLIVNNLGLPATWPIHTPVWFWLDADLVLEDSLTLSNAVDYRETEPVRLNGIISGPGRLTLHWHGLAKFPFYVGATGGVSPNSYGGGTRLEGYANDQGYFEPRKNGAFGTGDVELNGHARLILRDRGSSDNYIADTAALRLETLQTTNRPNVYLAGGVNETVSELYLDGVQQPAGTCGAGGSGAAELLDEFFSGAGILTVTSGPPNPGALRNLPPPSVTANSMTLAGEVLATNEAPTSVYVFWGFTDGGRELGAWTNQALLGVLGPGVFSLSTNYQPTGQTVYYRCYLTNAQGGKWADGSVSFGPGKILNQLPWVQTNHVALRGTVLSTNHLPTHATVYWGTNDGGTVAGSWENFTPLGTVGEGGVSTNVSGLLANQRYYYRFHLANVAGATWAGTTASFTTLAPPVYGDIIFLAGSDMHYVVVPPYPDIATEVISRHTLDNMNAVAGQTYPASAGGGVVGLPRGALLIGDLTELGTLSQWTSFTNDWGLNGDRLSLFPVYEAFGNHDCTGIVMDGIKARNPLRSSIVNVSTNGYHYSWDWDFLHVVCLNLFPGNEPDVYGLDPKGSLQFLVDDLSRQVGTSGRPVVLFHHYGLDCFGGAASWRPQQQTNYFEAIKDYNVVAILAGHNHMVIFDNWRSINTCTDGSIGKWIGNFVVAHVTWTDLSLLERSPSNTWEQVFTKPISVPSRPRPQMDVMNWSGSLLTLVVSGSAHWPYTIQASTNLRDWFSVCVTNPSVSPFYWTDTNAGSFQVRFYRVRLGS